MMMKKSSQARRKEGHAQSAVINGARAMEMGHTKRQERMRKKGINSSENNRDYYFQREERDAGEGKGAARILPHPSCVAL